MFFLKHLDYDNKKYTTIECKYCIMRVIFALPSSYPLNNLQKNVPSIILFITYD